MIPRFKPHNGGKCPVKPFTWVDVIRRDGVEYIDVRAGALDWHYFGPDRYDIVGWRLSEWESRVRRRTAASVAIGLLAAGGVLITVGMLGMLFQELTTAIFLTFSVFGGKP